MQFTKALQHTIVWKALNTILIFFINLLLVRILGAGSSGDFFYAITALSFFILILSGSVESGITYYGSNDSTNIFPLSVFILPWLILQALASWLLLGFIEVKIDNQLSWLFVITNLVILYFSALYYSKKWFLSLNLCILLVNAIVLFALWWMYAKEGNEYEQAPDILNRMPHLPGHSRSYNLATWIYCGGLLLQAALLVILYFARAGFKTGVSVNKPTLIKKVFAYSGIAFISNILFFLVTRIDYYFVQKYCDETALSNYVQVSKMGQLFILLPTMIATVLFPLSAGVENKEYLHKLQSLCRIITVLFIPVALIIISCGYWLFPWLFGEGFRQMYTAMVLYLPGFYALSMVTLLAAYLAGRAMLITNLLASVISLIVIITGDWLLIPAYGINGAASISSGAYIVCLAYLLNVFKRRIGCRYTDFFGIRRGDIQLIFSKLKK